MFACMEVPARPKDPGLERQPSRRARLVSASAVGWLVLLAGAGASTGNPGFRLGVPDGAVLAFAALGVALVWISGVRGLGGFLLPVGLLIAGSFFLPHSQGALLFSGPPLFAFALAALALAVRALGQSPPKAVLLPAFFAIYSVVAYQAQSSVGPEGDEPQYLMVADSLLRDGDLALDLDFLERRYSSFYSRPLEPHFRIRGPEGQIYSLHAVGLPVLIFPAYWIGGYAGASFFMALLGALIVREVRRLVEEMSADPALAEATAWIVGLSPPLIHFAGLIFTEIPAALLLCLGLRSAVYGRAPRAFLVAALCAAALPWLNVRYGILSVAIVGALVFKLTRECGAAPSLLVRFRPLLAPGLVLGGSAFAIGLYHFLLWGFWDPRRVYGKRREFSLNVLPEGLPGLFFDQEFGLFIYAPIFVLSFAGFVALVKRDRVLALAGLFAVAGVVGTASVWPMWRGGFNPPARFLVPLVPILACGLALSLRQGFKPATALLAGWGLWCGLFGAIDIETVHRDRDGVAPFFRTHSGAREWTSVLPSFVLMEDRPTRVLVWPWALLLGLPLLGALRSPRPLAPGVRSREAALASTAFIAAAFAADALSPRVRSPERDATRLLGEWAIGLPGLNFGPVSVAVWPLDVFHEPHRQPDGLPIARKVTLPAGRYEIQLSSEAGAGSTLPRLELTSHRTRNRTRFPTQLLGDDVTARFTVTVAGEFDLGAVGGQPRMFRSAELRRIQE